MLKVLRRDGCKVHEDYKRVYLIGATNEDGGVLSGKYSDDPFVYTKIGLSQNPLERVESIRYQSQKYHTQKEPKEVSVMGESLAWKPDNFVLLGYTDPLPFAASVETMAQKVLRDAYLARESSDIKVIGMKDWYRPTCIWMAAFAIFEAISSCYKDLSVKTPTITWTIPKQFPNIGTGITSINREYLPLLKKYKRVTKKYKVDYKHVMVNSCYGTDTLTLPFHKWLLEYKPEVCREDRVRMLDGVRMALYTNMPEAERYTHSEDPKGREGVDLFFGEFKNNTPDAFWDSLGAVVKV